MDTKHTVTFSHKTEEDIYPMPIFCSLIVHDVNASAAWYQHALGFRTIFVLPDAETGKLSFAHLRREKYQDILIGTGHVNKEKNGYGIKIVFQAWSDIDELTHKAKQHDATVITEPHDTPWRTREVTFEDLDGYQITFTYPSKELLQEIHNKDAQLLNKESWNSK
jgi:uncharacterized glyoxalase superfamily protein PhnB